MKLKILISICFLSITTHSNSMLQQFLTKSSKKMKVDTFKNNFNQIRRFTRNNGQEEQGGWHNKYHTKNLIYSFAPALLSASYWKELKSKEDNYIVQGEQELDLSEEINNIGSAVNTLLSINTKPQTRKLLKKIKKLSHDFANLYSKETKSETNMSEMKHKLNEILNLSLKIAGGLKEIDGDSLEVEIIINAKSLISKIEFLNN